MNKLISIFLLGSALSLTACGGDSDSSGSSNSNSRPPDFNGLLSCATEGRNIFVRQFAKECLVRKPNLINGNVFSLSCRDNKGIIFIRSNKESDSEIVKKDIELSPTGKYAYKCV